MYILKYLFLVFILASCSSKKKEREGISVIKIQDSLITKRPIWGIFKEDLSKGIFFKNESGFYILITGESLYFITKDEKIIKDKIMLHFIREDGTFNNLSFQFKNKQIQEPFPFGFNKLKIAKIEKPKDIKYPKIRIGQYNLNGNLWIKIIDVETISANKLLRYDGEFKIKDFK